MIYTNIESLTQDGRDRSVLHEPVFTCRRAHGRQGADRNHSCGRRNRSSVPLKTGSVYSTTVLECVLRNIGIEAVVVVGALTDQCIDMALRDDANRGFVMICASDACTSYTKARLENAVRAEYPPAKRAGTADLLVDLSGRNNYRQLVAILVCSKQIQNRQYAGDAARFGATTHLVATSLRSGRCYHRRRNELLRAMDDPGSEISILSNAELTDFPCASSASDRVTPPPGASASTKFTDADTFNVWHLIAIREWAIWRGFISSLHEGECGSHEFARQQH